MMRNGRIVFMLFAVAMIATAPSPRADWVSDGIAVCTMPNAQDTPAIASDDAGGAIIVWRDLRAGVNTDIYAQRVDDDGAVLWLADGMPVCTANNTQSFPLIVPDGSGGAIVAWQDFRSNNVLDIYAQRLNSSGYIQWTAQGVAVCTGKTSLALGSIIPDGSGGAIIAWSDRRNATNDIFAQRIDAAGAVQWTANGVAVCAAAGSQVLPALASDEAGGAIVSWQDNRGGVNDIYAQRVDAAGAAQWTADGIVICNAAQQQTGAQVIPDGGGGAIIAWNDRRNTVDYDVYAQRIASSGAPLWTANGVIVSATMYNQTSCRLVQGGAGEAIVAWIDLRTGNVEDVYAQKLNSSGTAQWTANGVAVCAAANRQLNVQLVQSVSQGAVAVWEDERSGAAAWDVYAQGIDANGSMAWTANGVAVCQAAANQTTPQLAPDGVGGAVIAWKEDRNGNSDIYSQRVDAAGHTVVATLLQSYSAAASGTEIKIEWTLSGAAANIEFYVLRAREEPDAFVEIAAGAFPEAPGISLAGNGTAFSFTDGTCEPGATYRYRVDAREGGTRRTLFETSPVAIPAAPIALYQNQPNPFNPSTTIRYFTSGECDVSLEVYDIAGSLVRRLESGRAAGGMRAVEWNGLDDRGNRSSAGVYFYRLRAGKDALSRKMILVR
ncbi:MAG: T9SS type A sorting domain-containing protein [Candidatus Krumholzibacteria bacterium]|nr:T9SS type A sorting domain-containing protein [Candidatus Krumholzibacteria bacterium]